MSTEDLLVEWEKTKPENVTLEVRKECHGSSFSVKEKKVIIKVSFELGFEGFVGAHHSAFLIGSPLYCDRL